MTSRYEWTPRRKIGQLVFDAPIEPHGASRTLVLKPYGEDIGEVPGWDRYLYADDMDDDLEAFAEQGLISLVSCDSRCMFHGHNLIGLDFETFQSMLGATPESEPDKEVGLILDQPIEMYDFSVLGAWVWVWEGIVKSIDCGSGVVPDSTDFRECQKLCV